MTGLLLLAGEDLVDLGQRLIHAGYEISTTDLRDARILLREARGRSVVVSDPALFGELLDNSPSPLGVVMVALGAPKLEASFSAVHGWILGQNRRLRRQLSQTVASEDVLALDGTLRARSSDAEVLRAELVANTAEYIEARSGALLAGDPWDAAGVEIALATDRLLEALMHASPRGQVWIVSAHSVVGFERSLFAVQR